MLRLCGLALYVSIRECDALLLVNDKMDGAKFNLKKERK